MRQNLPICSSDQTTSGPVCCRQLGVESVGQDGAKGSLSLDL